MGVVTNRLLNRIGRHLEPCQLVGPLPVDPQRDPAIDEALLRLTAAADTAGVDDYRAPLDQLADALRAGADQPEAAAVARALTGQDPTP